MKKLLLTLTIGLFVACNSDDSNPVAVETPKNCDCTKYTITVTKTPEPNSVTTEDVIEEPWCGEETPYRIFIGTNGAPNYQTRIDMYYEIKCGANQY